MEWARGCTVHLYSIPTTYYTTNIRFVKLIPAKKQKIVKISRIKRAVFMDFHETKSGFYSDILP